MLAYFFWDPPRQAFTIPYIDLEIYWYSLFFAFGFFLSYVVLLRLVQRTSPKKQATHYVDKLTWYLFFGMLIGARLGHVFFYDWDYFAAHPLEIPLTRHGGLASHGGAIGIIIATLLFWKNNKTLPLLKLFDYLCVVAPLAGAFIRIGNFFNQEIQGTPTVLPWAVLFGHPADGVTEACHPVQLYEALFYLLIFAILLSIMRKYEGTLSQGRIAGSFLIATFSFRVAIEWFKIPQEAHPNGFFTMGQLLSVPLIATGVYFLCCKKRH